MPAIVARVKPWVRRRPLAVLVIDALIRFPPGVMDGSLLLGEIVERATGVEPAPYNLGRFALGAIHVNPVISTFQE